jgi:hypothetical protein
MRLLVIVTPKKILHRLIHNSWVKKLALIYLIYIFLIWIVLLPILNGLLGKIYYQQTGRTLSYDLVSFNPITLNLSLINATDKNPDGSIFWHVDRADINIALWKSLLRAAPGLDALQIKGLYTALNRNLHGEFNFADIIQHQAALAASNTSTDDISRNDSSINKDTLSPGTTDQLPRFFIAQTRLSVKQISYTEIRKNGNYYQAIDDFKLRLEDFSTIKQQGQDYAFKARLNDFGNIFWSGDISLAAKTSHGKFTLQKIPFSPATNYIDPQIAVTLNDGHFSFEGHYSVNWKDIAQWSITQANFSINELDINSKQPGDLALGLTLLRATNINIESQSETANIEILDINGIKISSWSQGADIGLLHALTFSANAEQLSNAAEASDTLKNSEAAEQAWQLTLDTLILNNGEVNWIQKDIQPSAFNVKNINAEIKNIDSRGKTLTNIKLAGNMDAGEIGVSAEVNPITLNGSAAITVNKFPLNLANTIISEFVAGTIQEGRLSITTRVELEQGEPTQVITSGSIEEFLLTPFDQQEEAVSFSSLAWQNTHINFLNESIYSPQVTLTDLNGRFIITEQGTTNIDALFPTVLNVSKNAVQDNPVQDSVSEQQADWKIAVDKVQLVNASFRFHDASLTPQFTAAVQEFNGELLQLSSDTKTRAPFSFKGNVDGYAPVTLKGEVQPFLNDPLLNATLTFKHLDLGGLSTYSSTYAGWRIERGQLTADLNYRLANNRILGDNHVEMDKLQLGERVRSAQAMDIPLRLALAMITDTKGLAVLDVNISGDMDDPDLHIGKLIMSALKNTLTKIVASPFRFLAGLVGSDEDLGVLPFNSGSHTILATAKRRSEGLKHILQQRPDLRIELVGYTDPISDTRGLQANQAKQIFLNRGLTNDDIKNKNEAWQKIVSQIYKKLPNQSKRELSADEMYEDWLTTFPVQPFQLEQLALARSTQAKQFLVQQLEVDPSRVFINGQQECKSEDPSECRRRIVKIELTDTWDKAGFLY